MGSGTKPIQALGQKKANKQNMAGDFNLKQIRFYERMNENATMEINGPNRHGNGTTYSSISLFCCHKVKHYMDRWLDRPLPTWQPSGLLGCIVPKVQLIPTCPCKDSNQEWHPPKADINRKATCYTTRLTSTLILQCHDYRLLSSIYQWLYVSGQSLATGIQCI